MRLSELHPEFHAEGMPPGMQWLYFDCPHCRSPHLIQIMIATEASTDPHIWRWNGSSDVETITVTPSINCERHWHGWLTNGELITA